MKLINSSNIKKIGSIILVGTILTATASALIINKEDPVNSHMAANKDLIMKAYDEEVLDKIMFEPQEVTDTSINVKYSMLGC